MNQLLQAKGAMTTLEAHLTPEEINNYFKICSCCEGVREVFEKYIGRRLNNYFDYLQPAMAKPIFVEFLIQEQKENAEVIDDLRRNMGEMISFYEFSLYLLNEKSNYAATAPEID